MKKKQFIKINNSAAFYFKAVYYLKTILRKKFGVEL